MRRSLFAGHSLLMGHFPLNRAAVVRNHKVITLSAHSSLLPYKVMLVGRHSQLTFYLLKLGVMCKHKCNVTFRSKLTLSYKVILRIVHVLWY